MKNNNILHLFLNAALTLSPAVKGQPINEPQPLTAAKGAAFSNAFDLRPVLMPGTKIAGHVFTSDTEIEAVALNDAGGVAFIASWTDENQKYQAAVFTRKRIVVRHGDVVEGKYISLIPYDPHIAINAAGRVAYEARFSSTQADAEAGIGQDGIFVEGHLVSSIKPAPQELLALSDDGKIALRAQTQALASASRKAGLFRKFHLRRTKKDFIDNLATTRPLPLYTGGRPPLLSLIPFAPFSFIEPNRRGQIVIPLNLGSRGFVILLATPIKH